MDYSQTLKNALEKIAKKQYDVVFLDVRMPDGNGLNSISEIKRSLFSPEIIVMTGAIDIDNAKLAIQSGAWDYIGKNSTIQEMSQALLRALEYRNERLKKSQPTIIKKEGIIGESQVIKEVLQLVGDIAKSDTNVLITGETGTGKKLFAKAIHENSLRADKNFVVVDCTVLPENLVESLLFGYKKGAYTGASTNREGLISQANKGTLFLDEIGELPLTIQKSFLRVLQERCFRRVGSNQEEASDFRLIAATHRNLDEMVKQGKFRHDLMFRLCSFVINLPPLKTHLSDIKSITEYYTEKFSSRSGKTIKGFSSDFFEVLTSYHWPGNVRELINAIEHAVVSVSTEGMISPRELPQYLRIYKTVLKLEKKENIQQYQEKVQHQNKLPSFRKYRKEIVDHAEKEYLLKLMAQTKGDIKRACDISELGRSRLYGLLKKHDIANKYS